MRLWHLLIVMALLLTACSGNNGAGGTTNGGGTTIPNSASAITLAATQTTQAATQGTTQPASTPAQDSAATAELLNTMKMKSNLKWKIAYNMVVNNQDNYSLTQYVNGLKKFRLDVIINGAESRTYMVGDSFSSCTEFKAQWKCINVSVPTQLQYEHMIQSNPNDYSISSGGTMNIIGLSEKCYNIIGNKIPINLRYCYTDDGIPVYVMDSSYRTTLEMIATNVSTDVADSDFTAPAIATQVTYPGQTP